MSDLKEQTMLFLRLGGVVLQISEKGSAPVFIKSLERHFRAFQAGTCEKTDATIIIVPYFHHKSFSWNHEDFNRLKGFLSGLDERFKDQPQLRAGVKGLDSLKGCIDPREPEIRQVIEWMGNPEEVSMVLMGSDMYLYNSGTRKAFLFVREHLFRSGVIGAVINGIMFVLSQVLIYNNGLLLHGSAVKKDSRTALFLGGSGAGKSTIARLARPEVCYSDDGVIIRKEEGKVYTYYSPFRQDRKCISPGRLPLKAEVNRVFLIEQGHDNKVIPLKKNELMGAILKHLIHFYRHMNDDIAQTGFHVVKDILDTLPAAGLRFAKKSGLWDDIW
jgi:hypothetical protein